MSSERPAPSYTLPPGEAEKIRRRIRDLPPPPPESLDAMAEVLALIDLDRHA